MPTGVVRPIVAHRGWIAKTLRTSSSMARNALDSPLRRTSVSQSWHSANPYLLAALLAAFDPLASYAAGPVIPSGAGAGSLLQQIQPTEAPAPSSNDTGLRIEQAPVVPIPPGMQFTVGTIQITGNTLFTTAALHALIADSEGHDLTLSQLTDMAARITNFYHSHGYPLARAIIPAQTIKAGIVTIQVIEARYGKVNIHNTSRVKDSLLQDTLTAHDWGIVTGRVVGQDAIDRSLLLLSDIPGVVVNATLKPGDTVGTSDMFVDVAPAPLVTGSAALDNYGNRYTGSTRAGGTVNLVDPMHYGDVLSVTGLTSGSGMNYGRGSYESVIDGEDTRLGGAVSALHYILGGPLANLDGNGTAQVGSLWARHPFVRSMDVNLYGQIQFDRLNLQDNLNNNAIQDARHLDNWTASAQGDSRDQLLTGGINTWSLGVTSGQLGFNNANAQLADAATAKTRGTFTKWNASLVRLQTVSENNALYLSFSGQWANTNLDPSQQMIAGGPYSVRAYDMAALSGDRGGLVTAEFRHQMGRYWNGQWQSLAFVDSEHLIINSNPRAPGINGATLSGAGLGLNWSGLHQWTANAYVAKPIGTTPVLVGVTKSVQAWIQINKGFSE